MYELKICLNITKIQQLIVLYNDNVNNDKNKKKAKTVCQNNNTIFLHKMCNIQVKEKNASLNTKTKKNIISEHT